MTFLDAVWVVASAVGLLAFHGALSSTGAQLIAAVAGIVAALAVWQLAAIDRTHRVPGTHLRRVCVEVHVDAPPEAIWRVVQDLGAIDRYMPSLAHAEIVGGDAPGVGAVRRCVDRAGNAWSETCTAVEPGRRLVLRFRADEPGFPFPASEMTGGWTITPSGEESDVAAWWELAPKPLAAAPILLPAFAYRAGRDVPGLVGRMARAASGRAPAPKAPPGRGLRYRVR